MKQVEIRGGVIWFEGMSEEEAERFLLRLKEALGSSEKVLFSEVPVIGLPDKLVEGERLLWTQQSNLY